jgi:hypothetical protein
MVHTGSYQEFYEAVSASAAALTGLLFVALTVTPRDNLQVGPAVIREIRAGAALIAFVNALVVSLFALAPGTGIRYPATVLGVIGLFFTAAATRSIISSPSTAGRRFRQLGLLNLLVLIFGTELVAGIVLIVNSKLGTAVDIINDALVISLLVGIARAWELVGSRDTGIVASIAVLANRAQDSSVQRTGEVAGDVAGPPDGHQGSGERSE